MKKLLVVGDVHAHLETLKNLVNSLKDRICAVVQVGDFELYQSKQAIDREMKYLTKYNKVNDAQALKRKILNKDLEPFPVPVYYINGNHEDFENLDTEYLKHLNIHYIPQGSIVEVGDYVIGGVGGVHSSSKRTYKTEDLEGADKRFYTLGDVEKLLNDHRSNRINVMVTHQASAGLIPERKAKKWKPYWEEGTKDFEKLLNLPKLRHYIHGHHHVNYSIKKGGVDCIGLGHFGKNKNSYVII